MTTVAEAFNATSRYIVPKVDIYFNGESNPAITFEANEIVDCSFLEETSIESDNPLGSVSANELTLSLANVANAMNPNNTAGTYYGKFVPGIKVVPYISIEVDGVMTDVAMGTFWTTDWSCVTSGMETSTVCYDRLGKIMSLPLPNLQVLQNVSLATLFELVFEVAGLLPLDYNIDAALSSITIPVAWLPAGTIGSALKTLAIAGQCFVYVDRSNVIQVKCLSLTGAPIATFTDNDQIINIEAPLDYVNTYSQIDVQYTQTALGASEEVLNLTNYTITAATSSGLCSFSKGPVAVISYAKLAKVDDIKFTAFKHSAWDAAFTTDSNGTVDVVLYGRVIQTSTQTYSLVDPVYEALIGNHVLTVNNHLIQTLAHATSYANTLQDLVGRANNKLTAEIRGTTAIAVGDIVRVTSVSQKVSNVDILVTRITLDVMGGMVGTVEGIRLN